MHGKCEKLVTSIIPEYAIFTRTMAQLDQTTAWVAVPLIKLGKEAFFEGNLCYCIISTNIGTHHKQFLLVLIKQFDLLQKHYHFTICSFQQELSGGFAGIENQGWDHLHAVKAFQIPQPILSENYRELKKQNSSGSVLQEKKRNKHNASILYFPFPMKCLRILHVNYQRNNQRKNGKPFNWCKLKQKILSVKNNYVLGKLDEKRQNS